MSKASNVTILSLELHESVSWQSTDDKGHLQLRTVEVLRSGNECSSRMQIFRGRPQLALQLRPGFMEFCRGKSRNLHKAHISAFRVFFAFLDDLEGKAGIHVEALDDINDLLPALFLQFLRATNLSALSIGRRLDYVGKILNFSLEEAGHKRLSWPIIEKPPAPMVHRDVSENAVKTLRLVCREYLKMIDRSPGLKLKSLASPLPSPDSYRDQESVLCLTREYLKNKAVSAWDAGKKDTALVRRRNSAFATKIKSDRYLKYGGNQGNEGENYYRGVLTQSPLEAYAALTLVAIETGWIDSLIWMDINSEWCSPNWSSTELSAWSMLISRRGKNGRFVKSVQPMAQGGAVWAIRRAIKRSEFARRIAWLEIQSIGNSDTASKRIRLNQLEHVSACPFSFLSKNGVGLAKPRTWKTEFIPFILEFAEKVKSGSSSDISNLRFSDFRDARAVREFEKTGGNVFSVQAVMEHKSIGTTMRYLNQKGRVEDMFRKFSAVTEAALEEVQQGNGIHPKTLIYAAGKSRECRRLWLLRL
jgi:hypothetical protein